MDAWIGFAIALPSIAGGVLLGIYLTRTTVRNKRIVAYRAFAASLATLADGIGDDTDPRRIAASLRLKADEWQRSADALNRRR